MGSLRSLPDDEWNARPLNRATRKIQNEKANVVKQAQRAEFMQGLGNMKKAVSGMEREVKRIRPPERPPLDMRLLTLEQIQDLTKAVVRADTYDWDANCRDDQRPPEGDWKIWLMLCGRGFGKTRTAVEWVRKLCMENPGSVVAAIAKDHRALRDVILEGESGLVACMPPEDIKKVHRGLGDVSVEFTNGSKVIGYTAMEPDAVRGQSFSAVWGDEFSSWPKNKAQDMLEQAQMCLRRSTTGARAILTTTPKRLPHVIDMVKLSEDPEQQIVVTRGTSRDNPLLTAQWHAMMERNLGGTRLGRQELLGELVMDVDNCLWTGEMIEAAQWDSEQPLPKMLGTVTGVDPSGSSDGDATGVVVVGWDKNKTLYIIENTSTKGEPETRYRAVCQSALDNNSADVVVEWAYGGDNAGYGIEQAWKNMQREGLIPADRRCPKIHKSTMKGDKAARAMPVVALYEQQVNQPEHRRIWHAPHTEQNHVAQFEDEVMGWDTTSKKSPNAMDAMVHACRFVMTKIGLDPSTITTLGRHSTRRVRGGYDPFAR